MSDSSEFLREKKRIDAVVVRWCPWHPQVHTFYLSLVVVVVAIVAEETKAETLGAVTVINFSRGSVETLRLSVDRDKVLGREPLVISGVHALRHVVFLILFA